MCVTSVPPECQSKYAPFQSNHSRKFVLFHSTTFFPIPQNEGELQSPGIYTILLNDASAVLHRFAVHLSKRPLPLTISVQHLRTSLNGDVI